MNYLLILYFAIWKVMATEVPENCNPYKTCEKYGAGSKVGDPNDCNSYFICIENKEGTSVPSDTSFECDSNYYFDPINRQCTSNADVCRNRCINLCSIECTSYNYQRIADANDCSKFYTCEPGEQVVPNYCPDEAPFFDGVGCSINDFACCDSCVSYCEKMYVETLDPTDCKRFYMCLKTGIPTEIDNYRCDEGKFFDYTIGTCVFEDPHNPCKPRCASLTSTVSFDRNINLH